METFEYTVKKDVRNNPVVREIDAQRHRELWKTGAIVGLLVLLALFWSWQHFELLRHGYLVEPLQRERAEQKEIGRHLRLEIETLRAPQVIERLAVEELRLTAPAPGDIIVIERATAPEAPPQTMVASR